MGAWDGSQLSHPHLRMARGRGHPTRHRGVCRIVRASTPRRASRAAPLDRAALARARPGRLAAGAAPRHGPRSGPGDPRGAGRPGRVTLAPRWAGRSPSLSDGDHVTFNDPDIQAAEIPGSNGIADARSLARLYAACVSPIDGVRLLSPASIDDALIERSSGRQRYGAPDRGERWGTGFLISSPPHVPLLGPRSFGHPGAGGELAFADDEHGVGLRLRQQSDGWHPR